MDLAKTDARPQTVTCYFDVMQLNDGLQTTTNNLSSTHIGLALEYLYESRKIKQWNKQCLSTIIHGFIGLESYVNFLGHELFFNDESHLYLSLDKKELPLKKLLNSWGSTLPVLDKIEYLLSLKSKSLPDNLKFQLIELNNLRNWLVHGFSYKTTYLLEPDNVKEQTYSVLDMEDNVDWKKKFPHTKFHSLSLLDFSDAEIALKIVLEVLKVLINCYMQPIIIFILTDKLTVKSISHEDSNDIYALLKGEDKNSR
ncbi:MAG: hypothetical protein U0V03_09545 [Bacteroidia bacterium]